MPKNPIIEQIRALVNKASAACSDRELLESLVDLSTEWSMRLDELEDEEAE